MFEALLFTGMRYVEVQRLQRHHNWFDSVSGFIHLPKMAQRKKKQKQKERWVRLNPKGIEKVSMLLTIGKRLPNYDTWRGNLRRWAKNAEIDDTGLSVKCTRKTWESWLTYYYPHHSADIFKSQGHTEMTSLHHYLSLPFTKQDRLDMKFFVENWVDDDK